jgi:hypothetical protein
MGGKVAKKLGDGLMALFGYPMAQENDAERAVRAALSIQRSLGDLNRRNMDLGKPALAARVNFSATGPDQPPSITSSLRTRRRVIAPPPNPCPAVCLGVAERSSTRHR